MYVHSMLPNPLQLNCCRADNVFFLEMLWLNWKVYNTEEKNHICLTFSQNMSIQITTFLVTSVY